MVIERPLELLNQLKGRTVSVHLKNRNEEILGKLIAYDLYINLVVEVEGGQHRFIRGDVIAWVDATNPNIKLVKSNGVSK